MRRHNPTVDPAVTTVSFQYGTKPSLGSAKSVSVLAPSIKSASVATTLSGLPPGTKIYYRVAATNSTTTTLVISTASSFSPGEGFFKRMSWISSTILAFILNTSLGKLKLIF